MAFSARLIAQGNLRQEGKKSTEAKFGRNSFDKGGTGRHFQTLVRYWKS